MANKDSDIEVFAADLYMFLVPRRLGILHSPAVLPNPFDLTLYTDDVGKAVLITLYRYQERFSQKFTKDYPKYTKSRDAVLRYCIETGYTLYEPTDDDVFESLFLVSAMILELIAFCHIQNFKIPFWYADTCWAELFKSHFNVQFYAGGGWSMFRERAQKDAIIYDSAKYDESEVRGKTTHLWLTRFDKKINEPVTESRVSSTEKSTAEGKVIDKLKSEDEENCQLKGETFEGSSRSFIAKNVQEPNTTTLQEPNASTEQEPNTSTVQEPKTSIVQEPNTSTVQEKNFLTKEVELGSQNSPKPAKSSASSGAIPKTRQAKGKASDRSTRNCNKELLEAFRNEIVGIDNIAGYHLNEILSYEENVNILLNDRRFVNYMKDVVEDPEKRSSTTQIRDYALRIIGSGMSVSNHPAKFNFPPSGTVKVQDNLSNVLDDKQQSHREPKSFTEKKFPSLNSGIKDESEKLIETTEDIHSLIERTVSEASKIRGNTGLSKKEDTLGLSQVATMFNEKCSLKIDHDYTTKQIETEKQSSIPFDKDSAEDLKIEEILILLDRFDSLVKRTSCDPEMYIELNRKCRENRQLIIKSIIKQFLSINVNETNKLLSTTQFFTAEKYFAEHKTIVMRLMDNTKKNKEAREKIGMETPNIMLSDNLNTSKTSSPSKTRSRPLNDDRIQMSTEKAEAKQSLKILQNEDDLDDAKAAELKKTLIGLATAHRKTKKLIKLLTLKMEKPKSNSSLQANLKTRSPTLGFDLPDSVVLDIIQNKLGSLEIGQNSNPYPPTRPSSKKSKSKVKFQSTEAKNVLNTSHSVINVNQKHDSAVSINVSLTVKSADQKARDQTKDCFTDLEKLAKDLISDKSLSSNSEIHRSFPNSTVKESGRNSRDEFEGPSSEKDDVDQRRLSPVCESSEKVDIRHGKKKNKKKNKRKG